MLSMRNSAGFVTPGTVLLTFLLTLLAGSTTALAAEPMMPAAAPATQTSNSSVAGQTAPAAAASLTPEQYAARRDAAEKQLRRIRFEHFSKAKPEVRKAGITKLTDFTDGPSFAAMLDVLRGEQDDVRRAMINQIASVKSDDAMTTLAYAAINEEDPALRNMARERLVSVVRAAGKRSAGVDTAIINALERSKPAPTPAGAAARVVQSLGILEAIPALITAQVSVGGGGGGDAGGGAISWILVGNQRSYIADLTPVVGDGSIGFDPTPAVLNEGVILAIGDAVVTTYHREVHQVLIEVTSNLAGTDTSPLGYDQARWAEWYHTDFPVVLAQREARKQAEKKDREVAARAAEQKKASEAKKPASGSSAPEAKKAGEAAKAPVAGKGQE